MRNSERLIVLILLLVCCLAASNITQPGTGIQFCGTVAACSPAIQLNAQVVYGSAALASGTPSAVTITGISPAFTSATSYRCSIAGQSSPTTALLSIANVSGSSFTITGPATSTVVINYICVGT